MYAAGFSVVTADEVLSAWALNVPVYYGPVHVHLWKAKTQYVAYVAISDIPLLQTIHDIIENGVPDED